MAHHTKMVRVGSCVCAKPWLHDHSLDGKDNFPRGGPTLSHGLQHQAPSIDIDR